MLSGSYTKSKFYTETTWVQWKKEGVGGSQLFVEQNLEKSDNTL